MLSFGAGMRFGGFDQIIQSALRRVRQYSTLPWSHGNAETDPPALHLFSLLNSLVAIIRINHGFFAVQDIQCLFKVLASVGSAHDHRQQRRDVVHHRLHPGADRLKAGQPLQVERCGSQCGHYHCAITMVAVGVFMELGVSGPMNLGRDKPDWISFRFMLSRVKPLALANFILAGHHGNGAQAGTCVPAWAPKC
jgi:hypothetical protein